MRRDSEDDEPTERGESRNSKVQISKDKNKDDKADRSENQKRRSNVSKHDQLSESESAEQLSQEVGMIDQN